MDKIVIDTDLSILGRLDRQIADGEELFAKSNKIHERHLLRQSIILMKRKRETLRLITLN